MVRGLLSLFLVTWAFWPTPTRIVGCSPNQQEQQQEDLSSANSQKAAKRASHSGDGDLEPLPMEIKEEPPWSLKKQNRVLVKGSSTLILLFWFWVINETYHQFQHKGCGLSWTILVLDLSCNVLSIEDNLQYQVARVREADHPQERMWDFYTLWSSVLQERRGFGSLRKTSISYSGSFWRWGWLERKATSSLERTPDADIHH